MTSIKSAFKRMIGTQAEDGQAIVLIALFMVVMLAMVGVAIDGGGLFLLWRDAQNAADTAALQAAYDRCTTDDESTWQGVGYKAADINGFDDTDDGDAIGSDFSTDNTVTVKETFLTGTGYVHVIIEAVKPSYFIQLVYRGPLEVKAWISAIYRVRLRWATVAARIQSHPDQFTPAAVKTVSISRVQITPLQAAHTAIVILALTQAVMAVILLENHHHR
jgi:hypothetical protein